MAGPYFVIAKVEPDYTWWEIDGPNNLGDDEDKIVGELNRLAAEVERLREEQRWIPVETPPSTGEWVIYWHAKFRIWWQGVCEKDGLYNAEGVMAVPTHWMPLPAPPAKEE